MQGLVIFDLDGTLFETACALVPAVEEACARFETVPPTRDEICAFIGRPGAEFHVWLRSRVRRDDATRLLAAVDELELRYVSERGELYPGVREMLETLGREARLAICSNGSEPYVDRVLQSHGIAEHFDAMRCRQSTKDTKTLMTQGLLARMELRPVVVVGDRREDVDAALANGLGSVAVTYGYGSSEELRGAHAMAASTGEVVDAVRRIMRPA